MPTRTMSCARAHPVDVVVDVDTAATDAGVLTALGNRVTRSYLLQRLARSAIMKQPWLDGNRLFLVSA